MKSQLQPLRPVIAVTNPPPVKSATADPLLTDLARLLADPRLSDALIESVRACIREHCYQLKLMLGEAA